MMSIFETTTKPERIGYNGHMHDAYFRLIF